MLGLFILPSTCNKGNINTDPIQELITQNQATPQFTILLYDMEKTGVFSKEYKHKYRLIKEENGRVVAKDTDWFPIGSAYYNQHESNVGMEVAAKDEAGTIKRVVGPPGYTNYIGNQEYGYWTEGINDTVIVVGAGVDSLEQTPSITFYDYGTKTTTKVYLENTSSWNASNKFPTDFVADTAYQKENTFSKALNSRQNMTPEEQKIVAGLYYWKFYPHQEYIRTLLQLPAGKIKLEEHQKAREQYRRGYSYYGILLMGGNRRYGTYSTHTQSYGAGRKFSRGGGGFGK